MLTSDQFFFLIPIKEDIKELILRRVPYLIEERRDELVDIFVNVWRVEAKCKFDTLWDTGYPRDQIKPWIIKRYIEHLQHSPYASNLPDTVYTDIEEFIFPDRTGKSHQYKYEYW